MRNLKGYYAFTVYVIAITTSLFHLYVARFGMFEALRQRALHLSFLLPLAFLLFPANKNSPKDRFSICDIILAIGSLWAGLHVSITDYHRIVTRMQYIDPLTVIDIILGVFVVLAVIEATRRVVGYQLSVVAVIALVYVFFGSYLPGILWHPQYRFEKIIDHLYLTAEGIFGIPIGSSATFVFLFILFGSFLEESGASKFFIDFSLALTGRARGGPAKAAVVASGLMGTVSGSVVANVVTTGTFTIPLMKKTGYKNHIAGAVEAVASTGGQIMPPVMGAAAFIMAQFSGISYLYVCLAAAIPACLYYFSLFMCVHLEAVKTGMTGLSSEELPQLKPVLLDGGPFLIPLILLVYLLVLGYTPYLAAFYSTMLVIVLGIFFGKKRFDLKFIFTALVSGAKAGILVCLACACAGIVVGVFSLTGFGLTFSSLILGLSNGILILALFLTMVSCILLGMGIPTTPSYIVMVALSVPALVELGVDKLAAHMFVFYFCCLSAVTPPVCIGAYAAAGIAQSNPIETGFHSARFGLAGFIIPFMFVYGNSLLFIGGLSTIIMTTITALIGTLFLAFAITGWVIQKTSLLERIVLFVSSLLLIKPGITSDILGLSIGFAIFAIQWIKIQNS